MTNGTRPRVDVGVLTWNTADLTVRALRTLLDTEQDADIRLLVRDNASDDDTVARLMRDVPEAEVDAGDRNVGFAAGVNTLLARSQAPWFLLLNSDAWPAPGAIGRLVEAAGRHPRAAAVVPRIELPDGRLQHTTHPFPSLRVATTVGFRWDDLSVEQADELFLEGTWLHDRERQVDWAHGAAMLLRREAVADIGGFDERFFFYAEDMDWCWRAAQAGWQIWFEPAAVVTHVHSASGDLLYAGKRERAHLHNALRFYRGAHGTAPAIAWWATNVAGSAAHAIRAARRRDPTARRTAMRRLGAQLSSPFVRERRPRP